MQQIRYTQRICTDKEKIDALLKRARVGVLGLSTPEYPYAVPVHFVWYGGSVYFHGMGSGKKEELLARSPSVCFTVYEEAGTLVDPVPCHADTAYLSVMLFGKIQKVTGGQAAAALQKLVEKFLPGYYQQEISGVLVEKYRSALDGNAVAVYRLVPVELTAKENPVPPGN
jgi:nitroimidazol reductase NimA-like FMN-containing flavoprotein (pyridoxamine 5'-phosphate oxidase superfamily)